MLLCSDKYAIIKQNKKHLSAAKLQMHTAMHYCGESPWDFSGISP